MADKKRAGMPFTVPHMTPINWKKSIKQLHWKYLGEKKQWKKAPDEDSKYISSVGKKSVISSLNLYKNVNLQGMK